MTDETSDTEGPLWDDEEDATLHYIIGKYAGTYEAVREARVAYSMGEIDLWFDLHEARTAEEWDAWEEIHGRISDVVERWAEKDKT